MLFEDGPNKPGRHETALRKSIRAAGLTGDIDAASVSAALAHAAALDIAEQRRDVFGSAQVGRVYADLLDRLGILKAAVGGDDDSLARILGAT